MNRHYIYTLIQNTWYKESRLRFFLRPFSIIFGFIVYLRKILYQKGFKKITRFNCPVIVVGNITVGGTGKTPVVIAIAKFLQEKGYQPGIILRGYKGKSKQPQLVAKESDPSIVGDEAVLLARRTNCPVAICADRTASTDLLLKNNLCDIIISDDGLQHFALGRTIEIAMIDEELGFGNGLLLPAGPLREPKSRLDTVDFCITNVKEDEVKLSRLSKKEFLMQLMPNGFINLKTKEHIYVPVELYGKRLHAVAGIGSPAKFFRMLNAIKLLFIEHEFPDHHPFSLHDFEFLKSREYEAVLMTEKDAVKCESFADYRYWSVPVIARLSKEFYIELLKKVQHHDNKSKQPNLA